MDFGSSEESGPMAIDEENWDSPTSKIMTDDTSPLLSTPLSASATPHNTNATQLHRRRTYIVAFVLVTCITLSVIIFEPAQARIFESAICRAWYRKHNPALIGPGGVEEVHCKIPQVQKDVASLTGKQLGAGSYMDLVLMSSIIRLETDSRCRAW